MDYGKLLKRGWNITWNNKWLWILGFLAALGGSGGSGGGGGNANFSGSGNGDFFGTDSGEFDPETMQQFEQFGDQINRMVENGDLMAQIGAIAIVAFCCLFLFFFIMWFVRLVAEAGLIQAVVDIEDGHKTSFREAFSAGSQYLGKFFMLNLVLWSIPFLIGVVFMIIGIAIAAGSGDPESAAGVFLCIIPLICLLIPYSIIVSLIYPIAQRGVVLRGMGVMDSIRHGWDFLKAHVGEILIIGLIFVAIGIGFGLATAVVVIPIILASAAPAGFAFFANGAFPSAGLIALAVFGFIAATVVGSIINAIMITFRSSTFTLAYRELGGSKEKAAAEPADPFDTY